MKNFIINKRTSGFTLAEVLITLAIIGVVAAMTLPTLIQNQQKRSLEVATQKFYSNMSQAVKKYMADEGVDDLRNSPLEFSWDENLSYEENDANAERAQKACEDFVQKYLKVATTCKEKCFADSYTRLDGEKYGDFNPLYAESKIFILSDGTVLNLYGRYYDYGLIEVTVDINGRKGPNKIGYDFWSMDIFYDGSIDESGLTPECKKENKCYNTNSPTEEREFRFDICKNWQYGGCFGHFLENGFKFDY